MDEKRVKCPWCGEENIPNLSREKSEYAAIIVRKCSSCGKYLAGYLDEKGSILEKVRTFKN